MDAYETYAQGRICLERGDRFHATGGPYYRTAEGTAIRMNEQGPFTFLRYCVDGARSWIEAWGPYGHCVLDLGPERPSAVVDGMVVKPYRIKPLYERTSVMSTKKNRKPASRTKATGKAAAPAETAETTLAAEDRAPEQAPAAESKPGKKRQPAEPKVDSAGKLSAIDAAARVLEEAGAAMSTKEMITAMAEKGYWTSPGGKTPHATLYSAILREMSNKGAEARFVKADRGTFTIKA